MYNDLAKWISRYQWELEPEHTSKTISSSRKFCYPCFFESLYHLIDSRACLFLGMVWEPTGKIETASWSDSIYRDGITVEVIRDNGLIRWELDGLCILIDATDFETVSGKVISKELNEMMRWMTSSCCDVANERNVLGYCTAEDRNHQPRKVSPCSWGTLQPVWQHTSWPRQSSPISLLCVTISSTSVQLGPTYGNVPWGVPSWVTPDSKYLIKVISSRVKDALTFDAVFAKIHNLSRNWVWRVPL